MAITIIKSGSTEFTATCNVCGASFRYELSDVQHNYIIGSEWVGCPTCGHACRHIGNAEAFITWQCQLRTV